MTRTHLEHVFIQPDLRRKRISVTVAASQPAPVLLRIGGTGIEAEGSTGEAIVLDFPGFQAWAPGSPQCYVLHTRLLPEGAPPEERETAFGVRELTVKDQQFHLNGRPIIVRATEWAVTSADGPDLAQGRRALETAREAGFNALFLHLQGDSDNAPLLDLADAFGMLLFVVLPPVEALRLGAWEALFRRDRNHPAIAAWYLNGAGGKAEAEEIAQRIHADDPGRLLLLCGTSVGTRLFRPFRKEAEPYAEFHFGLHAPPGEQAGQMLAHAGAPDMLNLFFAVGPGTLNTPPGEAAPETPVEHALAAGLEERQLDRSLGNWRDLAPASQEVQAGAAQFLIQAMQRNPAVGGYCLGRLVSPTPAGFSGMLTSEGGAKPVVAALAQVQQPLHPLIHLPRTNLAPREEAQVTVLLLNEHKLEGRADLSLQVVGPTNQVLWKKKRGVKIPRNGKELWQGAIAASGSTGVHRFVVRLIQGVKVMAEAATEFQVIEPVEAVDTGVHMLDPRGEWFPRIKAFARPQGLTAPVHIIPPLAHSIRAYPDNELLQILAQVRGGAVALFFSPPDDWNDLARHLDENLHVSSRPLPRPGNLALHYVKRHPVFEALPNRGLMRQAYRNIAPRKLLLGASDEDICGTFAAEENETWWSPGMVVRRHGSGRVVFTHLRVLEHLGHDPLASRLFLNMLEHFTRRSVPSETPLPVDAGAVEWLRQARVHQVRRWMLIGGFANAPHGTGHTRVYPPEERVQFDAPVQGWYRPVRWRSVFSLVTQEHTLDFRGLLDNTAGLAGDIPLTAYAYGEFLSERHDEARLRIQCGGMVKCWINGAPIAEHLADATDDDTSETEVPIRQGRNTLLVKCSGAGDALRCSVQLLPLGRLPLPLSWWK